MYTYNVIRKDINSSFSLVDPENQYDVPDKYINASHYVNQSVLDPDVEEMHDPASYAPLVQSKLSLRSRVVSWVSKQYMGVLSTISYVSKKLFVFNRTQEAPSAPSYIPTVTPIPSTIPTASDNKPQNYSLLSRMYYRFISSNPQQNQINKSDEISTTAAVNSSNPFPINPLQEMLIHSTRNNFISSLPPILTPDNEHRIFEGLAEDVFAPTNVSNPNQNDVQYSEPKIRSIAEYEVRQNLFFHGEIQNDLLVKDLFKGSGLVQSSHQREGIGLLYSRNGEYFLAKRVSESQIESYQIFGNSLSDFLTDKGVLSLIAP